MALTYPNTAAAENLPTFWVSTKFNDEELRLTWTIHNFSSHGALNGTYFQSPVLTSTNGFGWYLKMYPNGSDRDLIGEVSLYLYLSSRGKLDECQEVKFQFTCLDAEQKLVQNLVYEKTAFYKNFIYPGRGYGCPKFVQRDTLIAFLKDDPWTISCKLTICGSRIDTSGWSNKILPVPACTLSDDLESSFRDQGAGDIIIEVDGKEFLVYKGILQARSSVFAAMFQCEMKEQIKNRVIITDFKPEVVEEMLIYIYTGKSPNLQAMANDLLSIANKYNLERLKIMSAAILSRELTHENAIETLILADLYKVNKLKEIAVNFIVTNSYFQDATVWKNILSLFSTTHPNLLVEVISALFTSRI